MMPIQISRRLREWRNEQETKNQRAELISNCILATIPRKKGSKHRWQKFFQREDRRSLPAPQSGKPYHYKSKQESFASIAPWMREVNARFGK